VSIRRPFDGTRRAVVARAMHDDGPHMAVRRFLDPLERTLEVLFGIIMVVVFTGSISVTDASSDVHEVLIAAVGCNIAWGIVDAVMYLMTTFAERSRGLLMLQSIRHARDPQAAHSAIAETLPAGLAAMLSPDEFEVVRQRLAAVDTTPRARLERDDFLGAVGVFLLVFVSTLPVVAPFYLMNNLRPAMRTSQVIAIALLFVMGWRLGNYAGRPPWRTGLVMVAIGAALSALTYVLGG
jgi:hypothetical protein